MIYRNIVSFFISLIAFGCVHDEAIRDLPLKIISSDTTFLDVGFLQYQNAKFQLSDKSNFLIIHQDRKFWWFDLKEGKISNSVDLNSIDLVLPQSSILHSKYLENDHTLILFFPKKRKILELDAELSIRKETELIGLEAYDLEFTTKGDHFYIDLESGDYILGTMSIRSDDIQVFMEESRFLARFDHSTGRLLNLFGQFGEKRKRLTSKIMAEGIVLIDSYASKFYLREVVADPKVSIYDINGKITGEYAIGTDRISYEMFPLSPDGDFFKTTSTDQFYSMKVVSENIVVSNTFSRGIVNDKYNFESHLVVEDLETHKSYSIEIPAFQKIVYASGNRIYLVSNHPTKEDLILVTLEYSLGEH